MLQLIKAGHVCIQGGGWCSTVQECIYRARTARGSSSFMSPVAFAGHLSNSPLENPGFHNWNRVFIRYCDGASFSGNVNEPLIVSARGHSMRLFFRGQRVWEAVMEELLTRQGMLNATQAILSGDSAGGLAAFHHCNDFKKKLRGDTIVKCLLDGAMFLDMPSISGVSLIKDLYRKVTTLHNVTSLSHTCTSKQDRGECFFPQYNLDSITVPMFFLQSSYDSWQLRNVIAPAIVDPSHAWSLCTTDLSNCSKPQMGVLQEFRQALLRNFRPLLGHPMWGMHIVSCLHHTEELYSYLWNGFTRVNNMTALQAFSKWYFGGGVVQNIDCAYPCNYTCR
ncbi:hypothetical protein KP509_37G050400 [Ceratopteris richardii]|uniref:Pectin acetylesterase n=1 Tax=Ceratopteris richardii TaxID=49495 RepID=A0A8T2Q9X1_CERRI|nr:hypothetical protein KP509_37G050400 [Ceratopteris richardii]